MSWKNAPTRHNRAWAPMRSAAASASVATALLWLYVPGAFCTNCCMSGLLTSDSSSRLMSVMIPNRFSTNGRLPLMKNPAMSPQASTRTAFSSTNDADWPSSTPVASVSTDATTPTTTPTLISDVRCRMRFNANAAPVAAPDSTSRCPTDPPSANTTNTARLLPNSSASCWV